MSIADHEATLLHSSLDQARQNKVNKNKIEFYANVAFPPSAAADLAAAMKEVAPSNSLQGLRLTIEANGKKSKPHAGIPNDWLILRLSSGADYPPELFLEGGAKVAALPVNGSAIRTNLFAGQRVRVNGYPFFWNHTESGAKGISWNLSGVMAVGGGERRAGGGGESSESAFAKYRDDSAPAADSAFGASTDTPAKDGANGHNPFAQGGTGGSASNPFG